MTDNEIIKAWECCTSERTNSCFKCPFYKLCDDDNFFLVKATLDLINRQNAKISHYKNSRDKYADSCMYLSKQCDKLQEENQQLKAEIERLVKILDDKCDRCIEKERTEAVKEFANELYRVFAGHSDYHGDTILTKIACLAEGKVIKCAQPIDTNNIKAEAVKEFAERLKDGETYEITYCGSVYNVVDIDTIDNLVKEMVGAESG